MQERSVFKVRWAFMALLAATLWIGHHGVYAKELETSNLHQQITTDCKSCHIKDAIAPAAQSCFKCHADKEESIKKGVGFHSKIEQPCVFCHKEHLGKNASHLNLNNLTFHHEITGFPLVSKHAELDDCFACHKAKTYKGLSSFCSTCHDDKHEGRFGANCRQCHSFDQWKLDPDALHSGDFKLSGAHRTVACEDCHLKFQFKNTPRDCQVCHWQRRQDDLYRTRLGIDCGKCHSPLGWVPANWNHSIETGFTLTGSHKARACDECHPKLNFAEAIPDCYGCHAGDYAGAKDPDHKAAGFPTDCAMCHTTRSFSKSTFDHSFFPTQSGHHSYFDCIDCHPNPANFKQFTCTGCHSESSTNRKHESTPGYRYEDRFCFGCHPDGRR